VSINKSKLLFCIVMWCFVTASAWPVFVTINALLSVFSGEYSALDAFQLEPKRKFLADFLHGYKASFAVAAAVGAIAVIDYLLFTLHRITSLLAGITLPIATTALAFIFLKSPEKVFLGFLLTGFALYVLYRLLDLLSRLRRVQ